MRLLLPVTIAIFLQLFSIRIYSQEIKWQNAFGGDNGDFIEDIRSTNDGGFVTIGTSTSSISYDKTSPSYGYEDFWVVKNDSNGVIQWQRSLGGSDTDIGNSIQQTSDGGYICGGLSRSPLSGNKTEANIGSSDYWIIKLDSSGATQWQNTIGGNQLDELSMISQTSDGGYICIGYSQSGISGDKTETSRGARDYWILKLDAGGAIQWQKTIGGSGDESGTSIHETADGGFICGGASKSGISGEKTEANQGDFDVWVLKLDVVGNIEWQNSFGGTLTDGSAEVLQTSDGGYICGTTSNSNISADKSENSSNFNDYWIVKLDVTGNIVWENTIGGSAHETITSLEITPDNGFVAGGTTGSSHSGDQTEFNNGSSDLWVVKLDSSGTVIWNNAIGGNSQEFMGSVRLSNNGDLLVGGSSWSDWSGDKNEGSLGYFDCWALRLTEEFNGITGKLFIDLNSNGTKEASEMNLTTGLVSESTTGRYSFTDDEGNYLISVFDTGTYDVNSNTLQYYSANPSNYIVNFSGINQMDTAKNFAFQPLGAFDDLYVQLTPYSNFRPGNTGYYNIYYKNYGTTTLNPVIKLFPSQALSYLTATTAATSFNADSVVWDLGPLNPYETGNIFAVFLVSAAYAPGYLVVSDAIAEPVQNDAYLPSNYDTSYTILTASLDPNDIKVDISSLYTFQSFLSPYLEYLIRFQNTGTDTAFNVMVANKFSDMLDVSSFEILSSSHPVSFTYHQNTHMFQFLFENILLPDSNTNEVMSHGFVKYRIRTNSNLTAGDTIKSKADIFFDINAPVATNTAITKILAPTSLDEMKGEPGKIWMYPNPAKERIEINTSSNDPFDWELIDISGRKIISGNGISPMMLNVSELVAGMYACRVHFKDGKAITSRIIITH